MNGMLIHRARLLTLAGPSGPRRGRDLRDLGVIPHGWIRLDRERIADIGTGDPPPHLLQRAGAIIDARHRVVMPAFVDCHTHACWAGDRLDEFEMKIAGTDYLDILRAGGGIMSTVRAVRQAAQHELAESLLHRLERMAHMGTATVEVKSGYGLTPEDEIKMLRAIREAASRTPLRIIPTFLGAHAIDRDRPDFVEETINVTLRAAAQEFPGITADAFCEEGAWSLDETRRYFEEAAALGCPIRVHADQFHSLGAARLAVDMGAVSVDHLEATTPRDLEMLARSRTMAVALPGCGFHLNGRYAPARALVDAGGALAIATNCNPGSSPTSSMPFIIALACRHLRLTPAEAITAATYNAACVLRLDDEVGSLEPGKRADIQILDATDERELAFEVAAPGPRVVIVDGHLILDRFDDACAIEPG